MAARGFSVQILFVMSGLIVWGGHLLAIYIFNALACARGFVDMDVFGIGVAQFTIVVLGLVSLAALAAVAAVAARETRPFSSDEGENQSFLRFLTIAIAGLSAVAVIWETIPAFLIPPCA